MLQLNKVFIDVILLVHSTGALVSYVTDTAYHAVVSVNFANNLNPVYSATIMNRMFFCRILCDLSLIPICDTVRSKKDLKLNLLCNIFLFVI